MPKALQDILGIDVRSQHKIVIFFLTRIYTVRHKYLYAIETYMKYNFQQTIWQIQFRPMCEPNIYTIKLVRADCTVSPNSLKIKYSLFLLTIPIQADGHIPFFSNKI